ncbi:MAG: hypothetical protein H0U55_03065 [Rubrobacteraceae bacterium]|jgi:hypothetical protein|nr:hypothetical protein [Rubrobacteraceae bacterium]
MQRKPCPACDHPERSVIDGALSVGMSPRSIVRRYAGLSRKALTRHRDVCKEREGEEGIETVNERRQYAC